MHSYINADGVYFESHLPVDGLDEVPARPAPWYVWDANSATWVIDTGAEVADAWSSSKQQAMLALAASDITVLRCVEVGLALPVEWASYRQDLRALIGSAQTLGAPSLPARPDYPPGT